MNIPPCEPPAWADSGHLQTLLGYLLPSPTFSETGATHLVPLSDGDHLHTTLFSGDSRSLVLLFHGLNGSIESNYMGRTARIIRSLGHSAVLINHRDCGAGFGLANSPYHSGRGDDVSDVIAHYRNRFPKKRILAIGFSLGANALLNLLCGLRGTALPDFAVAVNAPIDLNACSEQLTKGFNRIYDLHFVWNTRKEINAKTKSGRITFDKKLGAFPYLRNIDELYTAPYSGFVSASDYYQKCSTFDHFKNIKTPTVIITAKDDPFIPWQPYLNAQHNKHIYLHMEERGGHIGYLSRPLRKDRLSAFGYHRWLDDALQIILKEHA
ncbi:MAG: alpha/beta fold hydrolase [Bdellovibrionaceae bacterium]|nr:alpha/beta fold hydrolase [Pseudobdellovibrionaceae bacterium]